MYVNDHIAYKKRIDLKLNKKYFESCFIEVDKTIFQTKHNVIIGGLYKPPNISIDIFNENLEVILNTIGKERKNAFLIGDYNINTLDELSCKSKQRQDFINLMASYSYNKLIGFPTRVIKDSSTLIDNIYSNMPNVYDTGTSGVLNNMRCSDHLPIFTVRSTSKSIIDDTYRRKRNHSMKNISKFKKLLKANNWEDVYSHEDAQSAFTCFINFIIQAFNESCPMETIKVKYGNRHEWINNDMKAEIKERERLLINSKKYPTEDNISKYKRFRNQVLSNQRRAARNYYHEQFEIRGPNTKSGWALIHFLTGLGNKNTQKNMNEFLINGKLISDNIVIADSFNEYFVNVGKGISQKITSTVDPLSYMDYSNQCIPELVVTEDSVKRIISQLNNSAAGYDGLPASIMKQLDSAYIIPLTYMINLSIVQGDFPDEMKLAKVLPIYKSENEQLVQNYRPISVLPYFSKIYERVIYNHIIDYIDDNNTLYDKQFGFRKGHSTSHAIITLVEKVAKALDTGKMVVGVYLDIRKAFDCVRHHTLLDKLYKMGIRGNMYCLIENYLMHRTQYVHYNGCDSSTKPIKYGVPQGSILGPLFFILFMNDFSRASEMLFTILFADDTSVFIVGTEYTKLIELLNVELERVTCWLNANGLAVNVKKTHYMVFHRAKIKAAGLPVVMQRNVVECVTKTKFLGVIIDNKLKWNDHITYVKSKISKTIGLFYKMRQYLGRTALVNLYYSLVFPYLIYCNEIWGNASSVHLDPIIKIQKRCVRIITYSDYLSSSEPIFQTLNILNFRKLVVQRISLLMFKIYKSDVPKPINILFRKNNTYHSYNTRRNDNLHTPVGRTEAIYKTFSFYGVHIWNHISSNIQIDVSYTSFKCIVKTYIQNNNITIFRLNF